MGTSLVPISTLSPGSDLQSYVNTVSAFEVLSQEEEQALARRFYDEDDLDAARKLVIHNLRFVVHIARSYRGYGLSDADLIQEGNIGLMKAVKRFDPSVGVRLVSFAVHWIRSAIHEYIIRNWRIVKMATTKAQRKLFFRLRDAKKDKAGWLNAKDTDKIAEKLGVRPVDVSLMEGRMASQDLSYEAPPQLEPEDPFKSRLTDIIDDAPTAAETLEQQDWDDQQHDRLYSAIQNLDERSRVVLMSRWLSEPKTTLGELAEKFGVSAERIRQLETSAMEKVRGQLLTV